MFRHVALFRWKVDASDEQRHAALEALRALPAVIPELRDYRVGPDAALADDNADFAVVADFDDVEGYRAYATHPAHVAAGRDFVRPILAERRAVQYEC